MASQQILFAETIAGMKKAFKRKAYESDSDGEVENRGNRGNKLKKRARFARQGQMTPTQGPSAYKEPVEFAGARRAIIHRNPLLVDDEGYEIDSEDDEDRIDDAALAAAELNPYGNIRLEHLLAPLTSSADLPAHSTLSKPFVSSTLTNLVSQSSELMRRENQSLWRIRHLWTAFCGDGIWMPCEKMLGPNDVSLYTEDHVARHLLSLAKASGAGSSSLLGSNGEAPHGNNENHETTTSFARAQAEQDGDVSMTDVGASDPVIDRKDDKKGTGEEKQVNGEKLASEASKETAAGEERPATTENGANETPKESKHEVNGAKGASNGQDKETDTHAQGEDVTMKNTEPRQDTRAPGPGASDQASSTTSEAPEQTFIHPIFSTPAGAIPDRDVGLPEKEAEDVRKLLSLYVQKQEEICRGASKLHYGLLKAERLRKEVLHWSKAEAHCGPNRDMSDGEDWYDKEEWGLTEDLKKGQDEEEEDTTTTGKKTRNRR
ncbi:hypothetical protein HIM_01884 [Hirsutella minnesotensis 3608]|nr:hypothetical protein HIM_01884 [Hirsutella minnesotensis 3608]